MGWLRPRNWCPTLNQVCESEGTAVATYAWFTTPEFTAPTKAPCDCGATQVDMDGKNLETEDSDAASDGGDEHPRSVGQLEVEAAEAA